MSLRGSFGRTGPTCTGLDVLTQRLADMRQLVPEQAQIKDALDERKLGGHHGVAQAAMQEVKNWRGHAALAQAEQQRRRILAETHPDFHKAESATRVFRVRLAKPSNSSRSGRHRHRPQVCTGSTGSYYFSDLGDFVSPSERGAFLPPTPSCSARRCGRASERVGLRWSGGGRTGPRWSPAGGQSDEAVTWGCSVDSR